MPANTYYMIGKEVKSDMRRTTMNLISAYGPQTSRVKRSSKLNWNEFKDTRRRSMGLKALSRDGDADDLVD